MAYGPDKTPLTIAIKPDKRQIQENIARWGVFQYFVDFNTS